MSDVSILDVVKRGGYEASLITTFNATLPFYEEVVLRRLVAAGSRLNIVLMDAKQCAQSWYSEASMPRSAGRTYGLIPIESKGAFHPKICLLLGPKKASLLVGSHNLTLSGFGFNQEVTNWIEVKGEKDAEGGFVLTAAWRLVQGWVAPQLHALPQSLVKALEALGRHVEHLSREVTAPPNLDLLGQSHVGPSLWDQLSPQLPNVVSRIVVVGAFFDADMSFVRALRNRWPSAKVRLAIQPDTVYLGSNLSDLGVDFVNQREVWPDHASGYLHAKVLYFESPGAATLVSGSANPSAPAWLSNASQRNQEAVLVLKGEAARHAAAELSLAKVWTASKLTTQQVSHAAERSAQKIAATEAGASVQLVELSDGMDRITIKVDGADKVVRVDAYAQDADECHTVAWRVLPRDLVEAAVDGDLANVRSLLLTKSNGESVRVMLTVEAQMLALSQGRQQANLRDALLQLGEGSGDLSRLIASVERVIFAEDVLTEVRRPRLAAAATPESQDGADGSRPATLGVHVADVRSSVRRARVLQGGDLAFLISALISRIGMTTDKAEGADRLGRSEEEQIGQDDDEPSGDGPQVTESAATDADIAERVQRRLRALVRKMSSQLAAAEPSDDVARAALVQLIAVLSVTRELRRLRHTERWRRSADLISEMDRFELLDVAMNHLFGHGRNLLDAELQKQGAPTEEVSQLMALLAWLAWDLDFGVTTSIDPLWDSEDQWSAVYSNAVTFELFSRIVGDERALDELRRSVALTSSPTVEAAAAGQAWIERNMELAAQVAQKPMTYFQSAECLRVGWLAAVPSHSGGPRLRVVSEFTSDIVTLWDFNEKRSFQKSRFLGPSLRGSAD